MAADAAVRTLLGLKDATGRRQIIIWDTSEITIGRASDNDIVVDEEDVSRHHAILIRAEPAFYAEDCGTSNGTLINLQPIAQRSALQTKDVVKVGSLELTFIRTPKDPSSLGLEVVYASQLKNFGGPSLGQANPEATILSLGAVAAQVVEEAEEVGETADEMQLGCIGDFGFEESDSGVVIDVNGDSAAVHEEVDAIFGKIRNVATEASIVPSDEGDGVNASSTLSLTLELTGLTPELIQQLTSLFGKVIDLPAMRIRVKGDDLGE